MGKIPDQVMKQDELSEANLNEDANNAIPQQQVEVQEQVQPTEGSKAVDITAKKPESANDDPSQSLLKNTKEVSDALELQRAKSTLGRAQKLKEEADKQKAEAEAEMRKVREENERLRNEIEAMKGKIHTEHSIDDEAKIGELLKRLNANGEQYKAEDARQFIESVKMVYGDKLEALDKKFEAMNAERASARIDNFIKEVDRRFPGFSEMDGRGDSRWVEFLNSNLPEPMDEFTYRTVAQKAIQSCDMKRMSSVLNAFTSKYGVDFSADGYASEVYNQVRPDNVPAGAPSGAGNKAVAFKRSEVEAFKKAYFAKRYGDYGMDAKKAEQTMIAIEEAEANGTIDERR